MFSANLRKLPPLRNALNAINVVRTSSASGGGSGDYLPYDKDPAPLFIDPETQKLLKSMTQLNLEKVFRKTTVPDNRAEYKFMTTEQLEEEFRATVERANKRLQMPPIVSVRKEKPRVIARDPALKDFANTKFVFTDISFGLRDSERKVVIRQTDGTLEYAGQDVVKRMNQLYLPLPGRKIRVPRMFESENLKRCLDEQMYLFILDRLTVQYEPYEEEFHRISGLVYQHLNETKQFDVLRSTRHFGPMAFYYSWHRSIDDLLYDMIKRDYLLNAVELIALMYKIHNIKDDYKSLLHKLEDTFSQREPALEQLRKSIKTSTKSDDIHEELRIAIGKTREDFVADEWCIQFIDNYIKTHAVKKVQLELAMQTLKEINAEKKQLYEGIAKAHGVQ